MAEGDKGFRELPNCNSYLRAQEKEVEDDCRGAGP
jgi:hypothetical protein